MRSVGDADFYGFSSFYRWGGQAITSCILLAMAPAAIPALAGVEVGPLWSGQLLPGRLRSLLLRVWGLELRVRDPGLWVRGQGLPVIGPGLLVKGQGLLVRGPGIWVRGPGLLVKGPGLLVRGQGLLVKGP